MRFLVSAGTISTYSPQTSSAAARIAGSTVSRVAFMRSSANHSKTFCTCCGLGFWRSSGANGTPISEIQPAISPSGYDIISQVLALAFRLRGMAHESHEGIAVGLLLLFACLAITALGVLGAELL